MIMFNFLATYIVPGLFFYNFAVQEYSDLDWVMANQRIIFAFCRDCSSDNNIKGLSAAHVKKAKKHKYKSWNTYLFWVAK